MPKEGFKTITLREEVYNNYKKIVEELNHMSSRKITLSEFLEWLLEVNVHWPLADIPRLSRWGGNVSAKKISVMDSNEGVIDVQIKDDSLYCLSCKSEKCIHTGFSYALPDVSRFLNLISKKPQTKVDAAEKLDESILSK